MSRVNIEGHLFADVRLQALSRDMGSFQKAVGALACLWQGSQNEFQVSGTKDQVIDWLRAKNAKEGQRQFELLLKCRFIKAADDGRFEVAGNAVQLESIARWAKKSRKGGNATREKWKRIKDAESLRKASSEEGHRPSNGKADGTPEVGAVSVSVPVPVSETVSASGNELGPFNSKARELLSQVKPELIESWCETFKDPAWVTERLNAAANWVIANPKKGNKKDWPRFLNTWLNNKEYAAPAQPKRAAQNAPSQAAAIVADMAQLEQLELAETGVIV